MKFLNKLFLFSLMSLTLTFGAYASDEANDAAHADAEEKAVQKPSARLKTLSKVYIKAGEQCFEKHAPQFIVTMEKKACESLTNFLQNPTVVWVVSSADSCGSTLIDSSADRVQKFRANPRETIRSSIIYAVQTFKSIFSIGAQACANLERKLSVFDSAPAAASGDGKKAD